MDMAEILAQLIALGGKFGAVRSAHLYENGLVTVEGTCDSRLFCLSFTVEEVPYGGAADVCQNDH